MSSRALRRLQREEEERKQLAQLQKEQKVENTDEDTEEDEADDIAARPPPNRMKNAFDFLNSAEDEGEDEDEKKSDDGRATEKQASPSTSQSARGIPDTVAATSHQQQKKKKAKKKGKTPQKEKNKSTGKQDSGLDEIDLALRSLKTENKDGSGREEQIGPDLDFRAFFNLISIDSKHLNALNEMKKLFGSVVVDGERESAGPGPAAGRRRGRGPVQLDLGAALTGHNSPVSRGRGLAGIALRRNVFMPGKEEWPKATSGGLGMELVEKAWDFTTEYKFVHNSLYQGAQREFDTCVESMDPQRLIQHLQFNPYHISTLLQVSEIAKHQGDPSVSADLLERALFTFGRSVHSSFHTALSEGKARLDFRRPENREFWLTAYRYIGTLGQRGTWRTAFEWAKLILSLDPEEDPYCMKMILDQLAIRGGQFDDLVKLASIPTSVIDWGQDSPNVKISLAMAYHKLKKPKEAQETFRSIISNYPWVLARLYKELDIDPIPKSIWGRQARTDREELLSTAYALRAKDIWNTPEGLSLLKDAVSSAERTEDPAVIHTKISLNEARHIMLSDVTALIALLPRAITTSRLDSADPLPPEDNLPSYESAGGPPDDEEWEQEFRADEREFQGIQAWFTNMLSRLGVNVNVPARREDGNDEEFPADDIAEALENSGVDINELVLRTDRLEELRGRQLAAETRLRNLEDDLNNIDAQVRQAGLAGDAAAPGPVVNPGPSNIGAGESRTSQSEEPAPSSNAYDDEANQRWLAGRGMLRLKDFIAQHGADEKVWKDDLEIDVTPATEYAHRIMQLQKRASRDFILNYALKQGAGAEASDLVKRLIGA